ncbi:hypothetical protein [Clostridium sp.]|uniref:hypothetical protein n=1 Tax=Clostridium sp. TaxID=1506 RepID=UPI003F3FD5E7
MSNLLEKNIKNNIKEVEALFTSDEVMVGYFETLNYSAEERRKSPISGPNVFGYLFVNEWVWNTIFVVTNKNLYLINTKQDFEKVSINKIPLEDIEHLKVFQYEGKSTIQLKIKRESEIKYKPYSNNYLDIVEEIKSTVIIENKEPRGMNKDKRVIKYAVLIGGFIFLVVAAYIILATI